MPKNIFAWPDFSLFMQADLYHSFKFSLLPAILSLFLINFFDATSTLIGILSQINYNSQKLRNSYYKRTLITDCLSGIASCSVGTSPCVLYVESMSGIQAGAQTGLASIVTAIACIPFLFIAPLIGIVPSAATSAILIVVGALMIRNIQYIKLNDTEDLIAVTLTIIMMPLCFSVTAGAVSGIISYTVLKLCLGKWEQITPSLIIIAISCSGWFFINL